MTDRRRTDAEDCTEHEARGGQAELGLGWNGKSIKARGLGVIVAIAVLAIVFSNVYAGYLIQQSMAVQHKRLTTSQDRTSCMVAMSPEEREGFRKGYGAGAFSRACPWVDE